MNTWAPFAAAISESNGSAQPGDYSGMTAVAATPAKTPGERYGHSVLPCSPTFNGRTERELQETFPPAGTNAPQAGRTAESRLGSVLGI